MDALNFIITLASLGGAAVCYSIISIYNFNDKPTFAQEKKRFGFWGRDSWVRKYKRMNLKDGISYDLKPSAGSNWYYRFFGIAYVERFPLSATALVFLTDGYHFIQFIFIKLILVAIVIHTPAPVVWFFVLWTVWVTAFSLSLREFRKWRD